MAKKKRRKIKKQIIDTGPEHILPVGFWSQVIAVLLIVLAILLMVSWINAGGPVLEWLYGVLLTGFGYTVYVFPFLFIFLAIQIFRAEDNKLNLLVKVAFLLEVIWITALLGLPGNGSILSESGGWVGSLVNKGMLQLVNAGVAGIIYVILIFLTLLFMLGQAPLSVLLSLWDLIKTNASIAEEKRNKAIIDEAEGVEETRVPKLKLNKGVPIVEKGKRSKSFRGDKNTKESESDESAVATSESSEALISVSDPDWKAPSLSLLQSRESPADPGDISKNAEIIKQTLREFDVDVEVEGANVGPKVTQFTMRPASGVKLAKITNLEKNISLNLSGASLRIEAPIPGKSLVGIEVPNEKSANVRIRSILANEDMKKSKDKLAFALGKDISGEPIFADLNKMPHLLIAGQTGSGKSVMINTLLISLLYRNSPSDLKLILVDPKRVEMTQYDGVPHLLTEVITDTQKTVSALKWSVNEMERRYKVLCEAKVKDIKTYNEKIHQASQTTEEESVDGDVQSVRAMPYIVIVIDELADFMLEAGRDMEALIARLAQKARAVGIHLVLATQTPRADIITGIIKANIPARIAFTVSSQIESRIILDKNGAEKLLGLGDMLFMTANMSKPTRLQGALVTDDEISKVTSYLCSQSAPQYNDDVISQKVQLSGRGSSVDSFDSSSGGEDDELFRDAVEVALHNNGKISASYLQRRLRLGYSRASRIIDAMEDRGIISPADGQRPREVLISSWEELDGDGGQDSGLSASD